MWAKDHTFDHQIVFALSLKFICIWIDISLIVITSLFHRTYSANATLRRFSLTPRLEYLSVLDGNNQGTAKVALSLCSPCSAKWTMFWLILNWDKYEHIVSHTGCTDFDLIWLRNPSAAETLIHKMCSSCKKVCCSWIMRLCRGFGFRKKHWFIVLFSRCE